VIKEDFMCSDKIASKGLTRRVFLTGTAAAAVVAPVGLAGMAHAAGKTAANKITPLETMNKYGEDLLNMLVLRTYPVAVKMLKDESVIPGGAVRPKKDLKEH
jgi:hypothetical protein